MQGWVVSVSFPLLAAHLQLTMDSVILGISVVWPQGGDRAPSASPRGDLEPDRRGKPAGVIAWSPGRLRRTRLGGGGTG